MDALLIADFMYVSSFFSFSCLSQYPSMARSHGTKAFEEMLEAEQKKPLPQGHFAVLSRLYAVQQADEIQKKVSAAITIRLAAARYWETRAAMHFSE